MAVLGFVALGRWQLDREHAKRAQLAQADAALAAAPQPLAAVSRVADGIARVAGDGRFLDTPVLWLDNERRGARVGAQPVAGLLVPPPAIGLRLGPGLAPDGDAWLATRIEPDAVAAAWSLREPLAARVLRLDPALPIGHERDLHLLANTLPPERHRGYAVQWFGLAVTTVVVALVLNLRRRP